MATSGVELVQRLKGAATKVGIQGVRVVVDGTLAAVKAMDRLQELMPNRTRVVRVRREPACPPQPTAEPTRAPPRTRGATRSPAVRVAVEEARAAETRLKQGQKAERPLKARASKKVGEKAPAAPRKPRATGRKTKPTEAPAARRATARKSASRKSTPQESAPKVKRGQKHRHGR